MPGCAHGAQTDRDARLALISYQAAFHGHASLPTRFDRGLEQAHQNKTKRYKNSLYTPIFYVNIRPRLASHGVVTGTGITK